MTIQELNQRRKELGFSYQQLSERAHLPLGTIQKIFGGVTKSPRRTSIEKLEKALFDKTIYDEIWQKHIQEATDVQNFSHALADASPVYKTPYKSPGEYTLTDYYSLPDEQRAELIDGAFYDMAAPSPHHQIIAGDIFAQLLAFKKQRKASCMPFIAPIDVQLDMDNKTMVQPDVIIVCDKSKVIKRCVYGAPDFIVEVLSPATRKKDMKTKMIKYINAGVREYWIIDVEKRTVVVYNLEANEFPALYSFSDPIPVGVWGGECLIDLTDTAEIMDEYPLNDDEEDNS